MGNEHVTFENASGRKLAGVLDLPEGETRAYALFAHCFTCSKNLNAAARIGRALNDEGFALLRFDFTGLGESEGQFAESTFGNNISDLLAACAYLEREHRGAGLMIGHSLGGAAVLAAGGEVESVRCVATIGAPADPAHVRGLLRGASFDDDGRGEVSIGGRPFAIDRAFLEDLEDRDVLGRLGDLGRALMVMHSPVDEIVGIENAERIFRAARHPKSFVSLGTGDHLLSNTRDSGFVGHVLSAWAARHVLD